MKTDFEELLEKEEQSIDEHEKEADYRAPATSGQLGEMNERADALSRAVKSIELALLFMNKNK